MGHPRYASQVSRCFVGIQESRHRYSIEVPVNTASRISVCGDVRLEIRHAFCHFEALQSADVILQFNPSGGRDEITLRGRSGIAKVVLLSAELIPNNATTKVPPSGDQAGNTLHSRSGCEIYRGQNRRRHRVWRLNQLPPALRPIHRPAILLEIGPIGW